MLFRKMKRYSAVGLLLLGLISSAGCGEMHFGITINQDGSIDDRQSVSLNQSSQQLMNLSNSKISELSDKAKKDGYSVTESPNGFIGNKHYDSIEELVAGGAKLYNPDENHDGVRLKKGFLYDSYAMELFLKGQKSDIPQSNIQPSYSDFYGTPYQRHIQYEAAKREAAQINQMMNTMMQTAIDGAKADYTLNLPYKPISSNADMTSNDGKSMTWDLKKSILEGKDLEIKTEFRIYHEKNIIIVASSIGVIFLLGLGLFIAGIIVKEKLELKKIFIISGIICIVISSVAGIYIGYKIYMPEKLDSASRIMMENAKDSSGKSLTSTLETVEKTKENKADDIEAIMKKHGAPYKVKACSEFDDDGFIAYVEAKGGTMIYVYNKELDYLARVSPRDNQPIMNSFGKISSTNKAGSDTIDFDPAIFVLNLSNWDHNSPDFKLGVWNGNDQSIPVYVLYNEDKDGKIKVSRYYSAQSMNPSHYHSQINDTRVIKILDTLMNHYNSLKIDTIKKGV